MFGSRLCAQDIDMTGLTGGQFKYGEDEFPDTFDPITSDLSMANVRLSELIFEALLDKDIVGNYVPELAAQMPVVQGKEVVFELKQNVTWHDGKPFTAEDVKFTHDLIKHPQTECDPYLRRLMRKFDACIVLGPYRVKFILNKPVAEPYYLFNFKIVPKNVINKSYLTKRHPFVMKPIGTGPFQFLTRGNSSISLTVTNPHHFGRAYLDRIKMEYYADPGTMLQTLLFDGIDAIIRINNKDYAQIATAGKFNLRQYNALSFSYLGYNFKNPILKIKKIREAIAYGINRKKILQEHYFDKGQLISGPYAPASSCYNPEIAQIEYFPEKAKLLLEEAGCKDTDQDGILELNGRKLEFTLIIEAEKESVSSTEGAALAIADYLHDLGFKIHITHMDAQSLISRVFKQRDFDMLLSVWYFDASNDISSLFYSTGYNNYISYSNPEVDELINRYLEELDPDKRRLICYELHRILSEEMPYTFLWSLEQWAAIHQKVLGTEYIDPWNFFNHIRLWRIPYGEQ